MSLPERNVSYLSFLFLKWVQLWQHDSVVFRCEVPVSWCVGMGGCKLCGTGPFTQKRFFFPELRFLQLCFREFEWSILQENLMPFPGLQTLFPFQAFVFPTVSHLVFNSHQENQWWHSMYMTWLSGHVLCCKCRWPQHHGEVVCILESVSCWGKTLDIKAGWGISSLSSVWRAIWFQVLGRTEAWECGEMQTSRR